MSDVELYLAFISIFSLLLSAGGLIQSWKMRNQILDSNLSAANAALTHAKVTSINSENVAKLFKAIEDDRAAMELLAKRSQDHDRKLDVLLKLIMHPPGKGGQ